eukprot:3487465-Alexandrium_andersonii.AAC.1
MLAKTVVLHGEALCDHGPPSGEHPDADDEGAYSDSMPTKNEPERPDAAGDEQMPPTNGQAGAFTQRIL